jgi:hypothetical protein
MMVDTNSHLPCNLDRHGRLTVLLLGQDCMQNRPLDTNSKVIRIFKILRILRIARILKLVKLFA